MKDVKIKIELNAQSESDSKPILYIDRFNGLKSVESLSQSTPHPKDISYGIIPNTGSIEILDINGDIEDMVVNGIIPNSNLPLEILVDDNPIQSHISQDSNYNGQSKLLSIDLTNKLTNWQTIAITNQKYPYYSMSNGRSIITIALIECLKSLGYTEEYILEMLNEKMFYGYGENLKYGTILEYLNLITLPGGMAYTTATTLYDAINEICTIAQLNVVETDDGLIRFVPSRPIASEDEKVIAIPLMAQTSIFKRDILLKNKYDNVKLNRNVIKRNRHAVVDVTYSIRDNDGNLDISSIGDTASLVTATGGEQYICFFITMNSGANMVRTIRQDGTPEAWTIISTYQDQTQKSATTRINESVLAIEDFVFDAESISSSCTRLTRYSTLHSETFAMSVPITTGAFSASPLQRINVKIYSSEFDVSHSEMLLNNNSNIYELSLSEGLLNSELYCSDYGYGKIPMYEMIANSIAYDYSNGITTANLSVVCGDYYDINGNLIIDWSRGNVFQVGDIVQVDKDNYGTSAVNYLNGQPMRFRVVGRTFRKVGVPMLDLELQEVKLQEVKITSTSFAEDSWSTIDYIARAGKASRYYSIGDEKEIYVDGGYETFVILGFNHDSLSDGSGKAGITIGMKNLLFGTVQMDNEYPYTNIGGWNESTMRTYTLPKYLKTMPEDLQSVIKIVDKPSSAGGRYTTDITISQDRLWLQSRVEIMGTEGDYYSLVGEGSQYEYWRSIKDGTSLSDRIKYGYQSSASTEPTVPTGYWLRSAYQPSDSSFTIIDENGRTYGKGSGNNFGVCLCFCI